MGKILHLNLKAKYFYAIAAGMKSFEYRRATPYWTARLFDRRYTAILLKCGYPKATDTAKHITRPWKGYVLKRIIHPEFGTEPTTVYAIRVN